MPESKKRSGYFDGLRQRRRILKRLNGEISRTESNQRAIRKSAMNALEAREAAFILDAERDEEQMGLLEKRVSRLKEMKRKTRKKYPLIPRFN